MRRVAVAACWATLLTFASTAHAAERHASPGGSGEACSEASPCALPKAVEGAKAGDEVIVTAGTYTVGATMTGPSGVHIHGEFGGPMPRIEGSVNGNVVIFSSGGLRLTYLEIRNESPTAYTALCPPGGRVDRVRITAIGSTTAIGLIQTSNCAVRDSLIVADGNNSAALVGQGLAPETTGLARNVTATATGTGSTGIRSIYSAFMIPGSYTLDLRNVIASGTTFDLNAIPSVDGPGNIVVSRSNFDVGNATGAAKITASDNQTTPPQFVNASAGDYRPAAGSPTIDAGSTDQIGTLDLAGNPRTLGTAPDIGAYEFVPPVPAAASLQSLVLTPKIFRPVNAGGAIVSAKRKPKFKVGTTVHYALTAAATLSFSVERALKGRRVGKKCRKQTKANRKRKKCTRFRARKGGFSHQGTAGQNSFRFSGRINSKALPPGRYRLVAKTGDSVKRSRFRIVR
jgi:hypothetical protein